MGSGSSSGSSGDDGGAGGGASGEASAASIFAPGDVQRKCRRGHGARRSGLGTGTSIAGVALLQSEGAMGCTGAELSQGNTFFGSVLATNGSATGAIRLSVTDVEQA